MTISTVSFLGPAKAVLFDLDGVLTPTAELHREAWSDLFTTYFNEKGVEPYTEDDYFEHLDGRPRYDAVNSLLLSRGVQLPWGDPEDEPEEDTVCGLGNRKNAVFHQMLKGGGIEPYPGSVAFLDHLLDVGGIDVAVVSSSKNAVDVLEAADLRDRFEIIIDGKVAAEDGIEGKPAPDTYLEAATRLGLEPDECIVVEDAVSGVAAGQAGGFAEVIGVDRGVGKDALLENGATIAVADLGDLLPEEQLCDWTLHSGQLDVTDPDVLATIFSLTNGYLGIRGDMGLRVAGATGTRGTFLNGFHETWPIVHAEDAHGFARIGQSILTLPDATRLHLTIDGVPVSEAGSLAGHLEDRGWELDMAQGVLRRLFLWTGEEGNRVSIEQTSGVSLFDPHLAVISLDVTPLDQPARVEVTSSVLTPQAPVTENLPEEDHAQLGDDYLSDPREATSTHGALRQVAAETSARKATFLYQAENSEMEAALALDNLSYITPKSAADETKVDLELIPVSVSETDVQKHQAARWVAKETVPQGDTFTFTKTLTYVRGDLFEKDAGDLTSAALTSLTSATDAGLTAFLTRQKRKLDVHWDTSDVRVDAAKDPLTQIRVRYGLFTLLQASMQLQRTGVPAKGLTGSGYDGHYFWDSEIYLLPFLSHTQPEAAKEILGYRFLTLDAARHRAGEMTESGALFPWRTIAGAESSAYYPAGTAQYHINADVAYALDQYALATGDTDFMVDAGIDMLVETARLWLSLGFFASDGSFHIHGVTGPDEYTAVVNDNLYTNAMAKENLDSAVKWLEWLRVEEPTEYQKLQSRLDFVEDEIGEFKRAALDMHIPFDEEAGINPQDSSFLSKEPWDFAGTPPEKYPLLLHFHPLVIYRHQVIKQADTVLAMYLLGPRFTDKQKKANFEFYDPLTTRDSSLSAVAQAIIAAEIGRDDLAGAYFQEVLDVDLSNLHGNTDAGLHIASTGGIWSALVMGFGGLRDLGGVLRFNPRLPEAWESLAFTLARSGHPLRVEIEPGAIEFTLESPAGLSSGEDTPDGSEALAPDQGLLQGETVYVEGTPYFVKVDETVRVPLDV